MVAVREVAAVTEKTAAVTAGTDGAEGSRPRGQGAAITGKGGESEISRERRPRGGKKGGKKGGNERGEKGREGGWGKGREKGGLNCHGGGAAPPQGRD